VRPCVKLASTHHRDTVISVKDCWLVSGVLLCPTFLASRLLLAEEGPFRRGDTVATIAGLDSARAPHVSGDSDGCVLSRLLQHTFVSASLLLLPVGVCLCILALFMVTIWSCVFEHGAAQPGLPLISAHSLWCPSLCHASVSTLLPPLPCAHAPANMSRRTCRDAHPCLPCFRSVERSRACTRAVHTGARLAFESASSSDLELQRPGGTGLVSAVWSSTAPCRSIAHGKPSR
jgi:hypothetical protein